MTGGDIQVEDGNYTRIHNAILEAITLADFSKREYKCLLFLLRATYGWRKKQDVISYQQFADATGMTRTHAIETLTSLVDKKVIKKTETGSHKPAIWAFNKYIETWQLVPETGTSNEQLVPETGTTLVPETGTRTSTRNGYPPKKGKKDKENIAAATPAPVIDPTFGLFIQAYEKCWALPVSETDAERIQQWSAKLPLPAWEYALQETKDCAGVGRWKYLLKVLTRVQTEGIQPTNGNGKPSRAELVAYNGQLSAQEAALATRARIEREVQRTNEKYGKPTGQRTVVSGH